MKKIILVDVDSTVVETCYLWIDWYIQQTGHDVLNETHKLETNTLDSLFTEHSNPLEFWKLPNIYENLYPIKNSVGVLEELSEDYDIIFASNCYPEHECSKRKFIDKFFPFHKGFISTSEKQYITCDFMIDDFYKYIKKMKIQQPNVKCIFIESDFNKHINEEKIPDWSAIKEYIYKEGQR
jgi:5'(3')-deoxyribonucleotidase